MKAREIITESVTFEPFVEKPYTKNNGEPGIYYTGEPWYKQEDIDCRGCNGTGIANIELNKECYWCKGTGKETQTSTTAPTMNVSNRNSLVVAKLLGVDDLDQHGIIRNEDLARVRRRLIFLKNVSIKDYTIKPEIHRGSMRHMGSEGNVSRIGSGPIMIDYGLSEEQLERYIDELLKIIDFAQKNNAHVGWG